MEISGEIERERFGMNVGIIIFSRTGNTLSVAERIRDACVAAGHTAAIERVHAENEDPSNRTSVRLKDAPNHEKRVFEVERLKECRALELEIANALNIFLEKTKE
jgi:hypothetical protein